MTRVANDVMDLDLEDCRRLLRTHDLGRLAVVGQGRADIFPINYLIFDDDVYFRTAPGSKLDALDAHARVAFEIDGRGRRKVWSVVVHGTARRVTDAALAQLSGVARMRTDLPGEKNHFVKIDAAEVTGRSFLGAPRPWNIGPIVIVGLVVVAIVAALGVLGQVFSIG
jgi:nitroimidazol reductase NimA-like FMN-containing flavoprotein (pyridoxamine 5'-phosphate oxidase superfamily)